MLKQDTKEVEALIEQTVRRVVAQFRAELREEFNGIIRDLVKKQAEAPKAVKKTEK